MKQASLFEEFDETDDDEFEEAGDTQDAPRIIINRFGIPGQDPVAMAFTFSLPAPDIQLKVMVARWTHAALSALQELRSLFHEAKPNISLPTTSLRSRLELADSEIMRLDSSLGLGFNQPVLLMTKADETDLSEKLHKALLSWLTNEVSQLGQHVESAHLLSRLKNIAREHKALEIYARVARPYHWLSTANKTAKRAEETSYADLADTVARHLEGSAIFPELGGLRRIANGNLLSNQAELMTNPIQGSRGPGFSLVVRVNVWTYPGRSLPIIGIEFSRRTWTKEIKVSTGPKRLSAFALPDKETRAFPFKLVKTKDDNGIWQYQLDEDFAPIGQRFFPGQTITLDKVLQEGAGLTGCRLLVGLKHGAGARAETKSGVPDLDKMAGFEGLKEALSTIGLVPWKGITRLGSDAKKVRDRDQHWRRRDSDKEADRDKYARWLEEAQATIRECYAGTHQLIIAAQSGAEDDAIQAQNQLTAILGDSVQVTIVPLPTDVHGPPSALPGKGLSNEERARIRRDAWQPFINRVNAFIARNDQSIDGILVIAREWYGTQHDDRINKRSARSALASGLGAPVQYLRPSAEAREEQEKKPGKPKEASELAAAFIDRIMIAWCDLAYKSRGRLRSQKLLDEINRLYTHGDGPPPPDRVLALGVIRRNTTRKLRNAPSFLPIAIELDIARGFCNASFAYEDSTSRQMTWTAMLPLPQAAVTLARLGATNLSTAVKNRQKQLSERTQQFFQHCLLDLSQRSEHPLILIDANTVRTVWPWLKDEQLDPNNIYLADGYHAEADWPETTRIVRIRTGNSPKVLWDAEFIGTPEGENEAVSYRAPLWAEADLFRITDAGSPVYLSFGSQIRTGRTRGRSSYREIPGMKQKGRARIYDVVTMKRFNKAWHTPTGVEICVVQPAGDDPNRVARLIEWLRQCFAHFGEWSAKPAPLFFEDVLREYLADYELDTEEEQNEEEGTQGS